MPLSGTVYFTEGDTDSVDLVFTNIADITGYTITLTIPYALTPITKTASIVNTTTARVNFSGTDLRPGKYAAQVRANQLTTNGLIMDIARRAT